MKSISIVKQKESTRGPLIRNLQGYLAETLFSMPITTCVNYHNKRWAHIVNPHRNS